ncbi:tyrosine-type recombinase/integrase [Methanolobus sp.]|uniref:tyrosine-type recombinase/integrase n=1 Tax=Methanolobus sp. TaxID=1874737 RepID=UPI0025D204B1|nr:tyrosine-type recombinase/integrase [Methanolobus sp.]
MNKRDLLNNDIMKDWYDVLEPSDSYWNKCVTAMHYYTCYTGKTPEELIKNAKQDIKAGLFDDEKELYFLLPRFKRFLDEGQHLHIKETDECGNVTTYETDNDDNLYRVIRDADGKIISKTRNNRKKLSENAIAMYMTCTASFYRFRSIPIPRSPKKNKKPKTLKDNEKMPTKDELRIFLKFAEVKDRALLMCGFAGGMGASELSSLTVQDFIGGYNPEKMEDVTKRFTVLHIRRLKTDVEYTTFLTPEASQSVIEYLKLRDAIPDRIDINFYKKKYIKTKTTPTSPLFISDRISDAYLADMNESRRIMTPYAIADRYRKISQASGLSNGKFVYNPVRAHNMRDLFKTSLVNANCNNMLIEYWLGHDLGVEKSYYIPNDTEMLQIYKKYEVYLTIDKNVAIADNPQFIEKVGEVEQLKAENATYKVERYEHMKQNERIAQLEKHIANDVEIDSKLSEDTQKLIQKVIDGDTNAIRMLQKLQKVKKPREYEPYIDPELIEGESKE